MRGMGAVNGEGSMGGRKKERHGEERGELLLIRRGLNEAGADRDVSGHSRAAAGLWRKVIALQKTKKSPITSGEGGLRITSRH